MMHVLFRGVETQLHFSTRCNETGNLLRVPISREIRYGSVNENPFLNPRRFIASFQFHEISFTLRFLKGWFKAFPQVQEFLGSRNF